MSHAEIDWDPNEQIALRYRLFARAIRVKGLAQIQGLYPYLQAKLDQTVASRLKPQVERDGKLNSFPQTPPSILIIL